MKRSGIVASRLIFPLVLLVWPFAAVSQGVDIADVTYALGNYLYVDRLDPMWFYATWLPNQLGSFLCGLPGCGGIFGMNVCCTVFVAATALAAYFGLQGICAPGLLFASLFVSESLVWCPSVILYNTLTYLLLTVAAVLLIRAFHREGDLSERRRHYILAGLVLGLNLFVRFPNALEALLIIAVWMREVLAGGARKGVPSWLRATGYCLLGYIAGVIIPFAFICVTDGPLVYMDMIVRLFSMSGKASDYTLAGMLISVAMAYATTLEELLLALPVIGTGFAFFLVAGSDGVSLRGLLGLFRKKGPSERVELGEPGRVRLRLLGLVFCVVMTLILFTVYYAFGIFTRNYWYYDSMFELAMMAVVTLLAFLLAGLSPQAWLGDPFGPSASLLALIMVLISPIGSNNYTFPVIGNLFVVMPLGLMCAFRMIGMEGGFSWRALKVPVSVWGAVLFLVLFIQASLFHINYAFGDGTDGTERDYAVSIPRAKGMVTSSERGVALETLYSRLHTEFKEELGAADHSAIVLGNAPGLHYLMGLSPAIFTAWPDLDSNELWRVDEALRELERGGERPFVIMLTDHEAYPDNGFAAKEKGDLLLDFVGRCGYNELFEVEGAGSLVCRVYGSEGK